MNSLWNIFFFFSVFNTGQFGMVLFDFEDEAEFAFSAHGPPSPGPCGGGHGRGAATWEQGHGSSLSRALVSWRHILITSIQQTGKELRESALLAPGHTGFRHEGVSSGLVRGSQRCVLAINFGLSMKIFVVLLVPKVQQSAVLS